MKIQQGRQVRRQILSRGKKSRGAEVVSVLMAVCVLPMAGGKVLG